MTNISGVNLSRVLKYFMVDFDPNNPKLPNGICTHCRRILFEIDKGKPATLDYPIDYSKLSFPVLTRRYKCLDDIGELKDFP